MSEAKKIINNNVANIDMISVSSAISSEASDGDEGDDEDGSDEDEDKQRMQMIKESVVPQSFMKSVMERVPSIVQRVTGNGSSNQQQNNKMKKSNRPNYLEKSEEWELDVSAGFRDFIASKLAAIVDKCIQYVSSDESGAVSDDNNTHRQQRQQNGVSNEDDVVRDSAVRIFSSQVTTSHSAPTLSGSHTAPSKGRKRLLTVSDVTTTSSIDDSDMDEERRRIIQESVWPPQTAASLMSLSSRPRHRDTAVLTLSTHDMPGETNSTGSRDINMKKKKKKKKNKKKRPKGETDLT